MKIAILGSRGIPANYGGFETFAENIAIGFVGKGLEVSVYCPSYQEYRSPLYKGVRLVYIFNADDKFANRTMRAISNLIYDLFSLIHVCFSKNDIVYMLGYASGPFVLIPKIFGKKVIINPDGLEWKSKRWGWGARKWLYLCESIAAKYSDGLVADAKPIQEHFLQKFGVRTACIPYGAVTDREENLPILPYAPKEYFLAVARIVPETSIPMLVAGYRKSNTRRKFLIVGPIADQLFFDTEVKPLIDNENVLYLGSIYNKPLLQSYRLNAFALLHGHASDGTNPSLLESMSLSSPVIAVGTESNMHVLQDNDALYFKDADELASCIRNFESYSPEKLSELGEINRKRIEENFGWEKAVDQHLEYFREALV